jgi:hypothetical protein
MNSKFWLKLVKVRLGKSLWLMVILKWNEVWKKVFSVTQIEEKGTIMTAQSLTKIGFVSVAYIYQS